MGQVLLVTLREGIEMFLIVAIAAAYLRKTGRAALLSAVSAGTVTAVLVSVVLGVWLAEVAVLPKWESLLALIAARLYEDMGALDLAADLFRFLDRAGGFQGGEGLRVFAVGEQAEGVE